MIRTDSIRQQNRLYDIKFAEVELIRSNNMFTLFINKKKINEFISLVYILNDNNFFVYDCNDSKWIGYKRMENNLLEIYRSKYLILLYPKLIIEYYQSVCYIHQACLDYDNNIKPKSLLFVGEDFKISDGYLIVGNAKQMRAFRYNIKTDEYSTNIARLEKNLLETKKNKIYFDNMGSMEIYSKRKGKENLLYESPKYYKIFTNLYCMKINESKYIMYDIERAEEVFIGNTFGYIEQFITLVNHNRNEIFVVDREKKTIRVYKWDKYQKGETKEYIQTIKYNKFD